jgi:hypothetical protein
MLGKVWVEWYAVPAKIASDTFPLLTSRVADVGACSAEEFVAAKKVGHGVLLRGAAIGT